ncbi:MAG: transposase [Dechloromonas sp.]|nr:transposase [Candidatus Dechloromonas phosphoritropha]
MHALRFVASTFAAITQFMRSGQDDTVGPCHRRIADAVDYECPRQASTVRLIRQVTPAGKVRVLMTSLLDSAQYPAPAFADLYHRRWRIEEAFKRLKHRLSLEHTSGLTLPAACQDVGAKMLCDNLNALAVYLATSTSSPQIRRGVSIAPWLSRICAACCPACSPAAFA